MRSRRSALRASARLCPECAGRLCDESRACFGERIDGADLRLELALVNKASDVAQFGAARVADEVNNTDVVAISLYRHHDAHQGAAGLDEARRTGKHVAADGVVDQIDLTNGGLPAILLDVDEFVDAEVERAFTSVCPAGSDDVGVGPARKLDAHRSDPTASAVNEHGLTRLQMSVVE